MTEMKYSFDDLKFRTLGSDDIQAFFRFPNGYGCSVIRNRSSYGNRLGLYEMAVIGRDGHITYDTPITDDVIGHLDKERVSYFMNEISRLESV